MVQVKDLYFSFSKSERKAFRTYLAAFSSKGENKPLELLALFEKDPDLTQDAASKTLYGDPKSKGFLMMKARLLEKMVEFLPLSINPGSPSATEPQGLVGFQVAYRTSMTTATLLTSKKQFELAETYFKEALSFAEKCFSAEFEVDALVRLRALPQIKLDQYLSLSQRLGNTLRRCEVELNALSIFETYRRRFEMTSSLPDEKISFLEGLLPDLEESIRNHPSPKAEYYSLMLRYNLAWLHDDLSEAQKAMERVIFLVKSEAGLYQTSRMANGLFLLGTIDLRLFDFSKAIDRYLAALSLISPGTANDYIIRINLCLCYLHAKNFVLSRTLLEETRPLRQNPNQRLPEYDGFFDLIEVVLLYHEGNLKKANHHLQALRDLNFDKEGWLTGIRILEVMFLIELKNYDLASARIETLRKHLSRYSIAPREVLIFKVLSLLERSSFHFSALNHVNKLLQELKEVYPWKVPGHELIEFTDWFASQINQG